MEGLAVEDRARLFKSPVSPSIMALKTENYEVSGLLYGQCPTHVPPAIVITVYRSLAAGRSSLVVEIRYHWASPLSQEGNFSTTILRDNARLPCVLPFRSPEANKE